MVWIWILALVYWKIYTVGHISTFDLHLGTLVVGHTHCLCFLSVIPLTKFWFTSDSFLTKTIRSNIQSNKIKKLNFHQPKQIKKYKSRLSYYLSCFETIFQNHFPNFMNPNFDDCVGSSQINSILEFCRLVISYGEKQAMFSSQDNQLRH